MQIENIEKIQCKRYLEKYNGVGGDKGCDAVGVVLVDVVNVGLVEGSGL